jgi:hypothetical protein
MSALVAIPIGFIFEWYIQKKNLTPAHKGQLGLSVGIIWGALFGWLSICGMALGGVIAEKPSKLEKQQKKTAWFDVKGLKPRYWIFALLAMMVALIIPVLTLIISDFSFSTSSLSLLAVVVFFMFVTFFRENSTRKKGSPFTPFQKIVLIIIVGMFILQIVSLLMLVYGSNSLNVPIQSNSLGKEYENAMTYYSNQIENSLAIAQQKTTQKDYVGAHTAITEYISFRKEMANKLFELCDKAINNSISLNGTPSLNEMNLLCIHRDLQTKCNNDESVTMFATIEFAQKQAKTQKDCYVFIDVLKNSSGACIELQKLLENPVDSDDWTEMEKGCAIYPV